MVDMTLINLGDIKNDTMRVTGKGNKERTVYLNAACMDALESYLAVCPHEGLKGQDRDALFLSGRKQRISPKTVQHIVGLFLEKSGLGGQGYSTHKLRHTAATLLYQHGQVDVLLIKEILGHENLATTEIYTHVVDEQLRQAANANPLGSIKRSSAGQSGTPQDMVVITTASEEEESDESPV